MTQRQSPEAAVAPCSDLARPGPRAKCHARSIAIALGRAAGILEVPVSQRPPWPGLVQGVIIGVTAHRVAEHDGLIHIKLQAQWGLLLPRNQNLRTIAMRMTKPTVVSTAWSPMAFGRRVAAATAGGFSQAIAWLRATMDVVRRRGSLIPNVRIRK